MQVQTTPSLPLPLTQVVTGQPGSHYAPVDPTNPNLARQIGPLLQEATRRLYFESGSNSAQRIRALERASATLQTMSHLFGPGDRELLTSFLLLHHPSRETRLMNANHDSYQRFCKELRQQRGLRLAQERTPDILGAPSKRPVLKRRNSWSQ